ncbi:MAG: citrate synthase [Acidimicrobiia bacterium]|nr:citrate synthase [Acidimicrobiia bacterium]NNL68837.1 citrate synthase [Acidimicrobiia bacterium]
MFNTSESEITLSDGEKELTFQTVTGTEGDVGVDISRLRAEHQRITLDYGFANTAACRSAITYINGDTGELRYRGYRIEDLAASASFPEVSYLLIYGELPTKAELSNFEDSIRHHTLLNEEMKRMFDAFPRGAHPMGILSAATAAMSTFYERYHNPRDEESVKESTIRLLAKLPTVASFAYKKSIGQPYMYPRNDLTYTANFLQMMFGLPVEDYEVDPVVARALDVLLILHADHEQNCSTSTVRLVGSSEANLFASVAGGMNALWGPLHGGANSAVIEMLQNIHDDGGDLDKYVAKAKDKDDPFRLMGFGHRVYKNFDPRALILKEYAGELLDRLGVDDPLLGIARKLEQHALNDEYFVERKLYPNVDFYSGTIFRALGFPVRMFTVLFAIGRLPGWMAQWKEMIEDPNTRIGRPRQVYAGHTERDFVPVDER